MQPRIQLDFWAEYTLPAHAQYFQVLLGRTALELSIPQPVLMSGVPLTQVQHLALGLVKPHEIPMDPLLELVQDLLDGTLPFRSVNSTTQLSVTYKFTETHSGGTACPTLFMDMLTTDLT
ncbi:hypothetical protein TURU_054323 [Turdus rufiventris]|nr:hypothetical protein TURU_054323 [Turdus rufiventris]